MKITELPVQALEFMIALTAFITKVSPVEIRACIWLERKTSYTNLLINAVFPHKCCEQIYRHLSESERPALVPNLGEFRKLARG